MRKLLTEADAASLCGWSAAYMRARRKRQELEEAAGDEPDLVPAWVVMGRWIRYDSKAVSEFLARNRDIKNRAEIRRETLTHEQAASLLRISPRTLREWRTARRRAEEAHEYAEAERLAPPWKKVGREIRYDPKAVEKWLRKRASRRDGA